MDWLHEITLLIIAFGVFSVAGAMRNNAAAVREVNETFRRYVAVLFTERNGESDAD